MATYIGIDIGSCYTKVVELECPPAPALLNYIIFSTPYHSQGRPGPEQIDTQIFWQEITKYIPLERLKTSHLATSLPSNALSAIILLLPRLSKNELTLAAHNEARRKMIPASTPEHIFESSIIGTTITAKIPRMEVLVVRSEKHYLRQVLEFFQTIDITPEIITFCGYTLFTMLPAEVINKKDEDCIFVDIGHNSINTSILREGRLHFFRNISFGIADIIQDLSRQLNLSPEQAAEVVREKGVPEVNFDLKDKVAVAEEIMRQKYEASLKNNESAQKEETNILELRMLWQAHIDRLLHELRRSLAYYKEQTNGRRVEYIYFLGGGCQTKDLVSALAKQIGGRWEIILPFKKIPTPISKEAKIAPDNASSPIFTNALSLAISMHLAKTRRIELINFLPQELKTKKFHASRLRIILTVKIALGLLLTIASLLAFINTRLLKAAIKKAQTELGKTINVSDSLRQLKARENKITQELSRIEELLSKRPAFSGPLRALAKALPNEILLTEVSISKAGADSQAQPQMTQPQALPFADSGPKDETGIPSLTQTPGTSAIAIAEENYRIKIKAELFSDYEKSLLIIEAFQRNLAASAYFGNINITPLTLENISPQLPGAQEQEITLTRPMRRTFTLSADIYAVNIR